MIPTSVNATIELSSRIPAKFDAVVVMGAKDNPPEGVEFLGQAEAKAVEAIVSAGAGPVKAGEMVVQVVVDEAMVKGSGRGGGTGKVGAGHRLIVVGLGAMEKVKAQTLREAGAAVARAAKKHKLGNVTVIVPDALQESLPGQTIAESAVESIALGFLLGSFSFKEFKGTGSKSAGEKENGKGVRLTLVVESVDASVKAALERAAAMAEGQNLARTIASRPGNEINPPALAKLAQQVAKEVGLLCRVLDERELKKLGMGGILAVGSGSVTPPRLIALEHKGSGVRVQGSGRKSGKDGGPIVLVGKSITFDTGGISIKPADKMGDMIYDKCGGMAVLGTMVALARMKYPGRVIGILTSAENHVSGTAYRPGDIIKLYNGVTAEITNTDAEGRLVLSDALAWGIETYKPAAIVDLATLTGGVVVALGHTQAGLFSNDDELAAELMAAAGVAGEKVWRLPVGQDQRDMIKSNHADIVNSAGRWASPLTGAAFLTFALPGAGDEESDAKKVPWVHLDIAGVADTEKELPLYAKGATGWGVRTLLAWLGGRI